MLLALAVGKGDVMKKVAQIAAIVAALAVAASSALALSVSTSCGGGTCTVTINGVSKSYPGSSARVFTTSKNGVEGYKVFVDGRLVDQK
jgi:uncharacterized protein (DUF2141 family)